MSYNLIHQFKTEAWLISDKQTQATICIVTATTETEALFRAQLLRSDFVNMPPLERLVATECTPEFLQSAADINQGFFLVVDFSTEGGTDQTVH